MEAIILAGGFGTRLIPLTYTKPKALLPILNKPLLSYVVEGLPEEIEKIVVAVNYKDDLIERFFKENEFKKEIIINKEPKPLGTGGAVKLAEKYITDSFFVLNGDILSSLDIREMAHFHKEKKADITISLYPVEDVLEFGVVDISKGKIKNFIEKPKLGEAPSNLVNAGTYLIEPDILDYIEYGEFSSMEEDVFPRLIEDGKSLYGFEIEGYWIDVGKIENYLKAHKILMKNKKIKSFIGRNSVVNGEVIGSSIGDNSYIDEYSIIEDSVVFNNCEIERYVEIKNSIIGEGCKIGKNSHLFKSVVGDDEVIKENSFIIKDSIWTKEVPKNYPKQQIGNVVKW